MQAKVIIGANFGDEGKGLFTDYAVSGSRDPVLVIRFNGGAQAGHTVTTPDGRRHVFGHFGAGSFLGAATYLSRFFVCNPMTFLKEWDLLARHYVTPMVFAAPACPVTTPYDMMINQMVEEARGHARHGSCGLGFGETLERQLRPQFVLTVSDLSDRNELIRKLYLIRSQWVPERLHTLGITAPPTPEWTRRLSSDEILQAYLDATEEFLGRITPAGNDILSCYDSLVFEGAQGLLLDQNHAWFPHVTRSFTGLANVVALAEESGIDTLDVTYATRAYLTRHGAGPLPRELEGKPYAKIVDATNIPNAFQGHLRFAHLDLDLLAQTIRHDLTRAGTLRIIPRLGLSCLDQVDNRVTYYEHGTRHSNEIGDFIDAALEHIGFQDAQLSFGPTRQTIQNYMRHHQISAFLSKAPRSEHTRI